MTDVVLVSTPGDTIVIQNEATSIITIQDTPNSIIEVVSVGPQGPQGPQGDSAGQNMVIDSVPPVFPAGEKGLWIQTGLGVSGNDVTFWIEDGL